MASRLVRPPMVTEAPNDAAGKVEATEKINTVLARWQVEHLDTLRLRLRYDSGCYLGRAGLIRGLLAGVLESPLDLSAITSEDDVKGLVRDVIERGLDGDDETDEAVETVVEVAAPQPA